uniref:Uncharacterized protein n=1 Tax=Lepeophtheirus salmonis TaxID=72036 RepID=A0A0K2TNE8_LEPSM
MTTQGNPCILSLKILSVHVVIFNISRNLSPEKKHRLMAKISCYLAKSVNNTHSNLFFKYFQTIVVILFNNF